MSIYKQFSKNLRRVLSMRGIKQVEIAKAIDVPATTISSWTTGRHLPELDRLMMLCNYLEMPVGELVGDKRHPKDPKELNDYTQLLVERNMELEAKLSSNVKPLSKQNELEIVKLLKEAGVTECLLKF